MLHTKLIIAAWLLLLVPTLLLGVGAWQLLQNEGERLIQREQQAAAERLASVAASERDANATRSSIRIAQRAFLRGRLFLLVHPL